MHLLDTMVLSENFKRHPHPPVVEWLRSADQASLFVSVITFGEIAIGIEKKRLADEVFFGKLTDWLDETRRDFEPRTLPITTVVAMRWGTLAMQLRRRDTDILIAATALEHDLTIVTRNIRHFAPTGAKLFNPYED